MNKFSWSMLVAVVAGTFGLMVYVHSSTVSERRFQDLRDDYQADVKAIRADIRAINVKLDNI